MSLRFPLFVFLVLLIASCGKKKTDASQLGQDSASTAVQPINYDIPIEAGRPVTLVKALPFREQLLAFSIELGNRSKDFNQRLGLILFAKRSGEPWREAVRNNIARENYRNAEMYHTAYLDSLRGVIRPTDAALKSSYNELLIAHKRWRNNYQILHDHEKFESMIAVLDTVLSNEMAINKALKDFKNTIDTKP